MVGHGVGTVATRIYRLHPASDCDRTSKSDFDIVVWQRATFGLGLEDP